MSSQEYSTLESLIRPATHREFFETIENSKHQHYEGSQNNARELFGYRKLEQLLNRSFSQLRYPQLKMALDGKIIPIEDLSECVATSKKGFYRRFLRSKVQKKLDEGATLILNDLEDFDPTIKKFQAELRSDIRERLRINSYYSPGGAPGFGLHFDSHDVLVIQTEGSKTWTLRGISHAFPLECQPFTDFTPPSKDLINIHLKKGDVLFIPRGMWHKAVAEDSPSLHLTVGIYALTCTDLLEELVEAARQNTGMRRNLQRWHPELARKSSENSIREVLEFAKAHLTNTLDQGGGIRLSPTDQDQSPKFRFVTD